MNSLDTLLRVQHLLEWQNTLKDGDTSLNFLPEALTLLKQGIQEVAQERDESEKRLERALTPVKTRYDQRHIQRIDNPHDLLKDVDLTSRVSDSPLFAELRKQHPDLFNNPLAPQNEQELAFDRAVFDLFVKSPMNLAHHANILSEYAIPQAMLNIPGFTAKAAYLVHMDDSLYDTEYPEHPAIVLLVLGKGETHIELHVDRGEQRERAVFTVLAETMLLVKDKERKD